MPEIMPAVAGELIQVLMEKIHEPLMQAALRVLRDANADMSRYRGSSRLQERVRWAGKIFLAQLDVMGNLYPAMGKPNPYDRNHIDILEALQLAQVVDAASR